MGVIGEEMLSTSGAARLLGVKDPATVRRWCKTGFRGVVLESVALPGGLKTSRQAVERFAARVQAARYGGDPLPSGRTRNRRAEAALERLRQQGVL